MQEAITAENAPKPDAHRVTVRIGINYGLGFVKSNDVFGDVVNVASRVEGAASPEQILISDTLHQAVAPTGRFRFQLAGKFALKGKAEASNLYEVVWREQAGAPVNAHSMVMAAFDAPQVKYKLVQVRTDGRPGREFEVSREAVVGRTQGEVIFANDEYMQPAHARLLVDSGQLFVELMPEAFRSSAWSAPSACSTATWSASARRFWSSAWTKPRWQQLPAPAQVSAD